MKSDTVFCTNCGAKYNVNNIGNHLEICKDCQIDLGISRFNELKNTNSTTKKSHRIEIDMGIPGYPNQPCELLNQIIESENGYISQHSCEIGHLDNGVECYFVEVTSESGTQYGIRAYGLEAKDLQQLTLSILGSKKNK